MAVLVPAGSEVTSRTAAAVLADPFAETLLPFAVPLEAKLRDHIIALAGPDLAANHARLGKAATEALEATITRDLEKLGQTKEDFRFFLAFAGEVMDRYGRLLGYLHPSQPDTPAADRLLSYHERLLQLGWVSPYFIWPNINPFRRAGKWKRPCLGRVLLRHRRA